MKFLKKGKKEEMPIDESLDVPPQPPSLKEDLPHLPEFEKEFPKEDLPPFKFKEEKPMPRVELPELPKEKEPEFEIPDFPPLEEKPEFIPKPPMKESVREMPLPKKEPEAEPLQKKLEEEAVREERRLLRRPLTTDEPLFIRLSKFKETLRSMSTIRGDLKKSDEILLNLIRSKEEKDKEFEKWHSMMDDIQKKLIFIEKTLFKGD